MAALERGQASSFASPGAGDFCGLHRRLVRHLSVHKKAVLDQPAVQAAFAAQGVQLLLADWTHYDSAITASLQQLGRSGLPVYVLIDRQGRQTLPPCSSVPR